MSAVLRLFSATRLNAASSSAAIAPHERLECLKRTWQAIQLCSVLEDKWERQEKLLPSITRFRALLVDECIVADICAPNACLLYALEKEIFHYLVTIAITGLPSITRSIVTTLADLVEVHNEDLLTHEAIFWNINVLFEWFLGETYKGTTLLAMADLLFAVCTKILHCPLLLHMFFDGKGWILRTKNRCRTNTQTVKTSEIQLTSKGDFLLFHLLIDNLSISGHVGDLCRTGLFYLLQTAKKVVGTMQWLENSTLAEALTRGLASHYLYLGRILASNHESRHCSSAGSPRLSKTDHGQQKLELEVSQTYLAYWQDVYEILENKNIRQGLLDSFRRFFLDDILRPAICASVKDTSKHVVYVWLGAIFDILRIPAVVELTIGHCFGTGAPYESTHLAASPTSTILLDEMHNVPLQSGRFSLEKYVLCYLDSDAEDCRLAAITLLDSLVVHHWQIVAPVFCSGKKVTKVEAVRAFGRIDQRRRVNSLACAGLIATEITQSTKNHTYDADSRLVAQCEDLERLLCPLTDTSDQITVSAAQCTFQGSDALLASLLLVLQNFFENSIELNLALSKLWTDLVSSPHQSLDGLLWATVAKDFYNESFLEANFENSTERLLDELEGAYQEELESLQEIESSFFDETDIGASDTQGNDMYSTDEVSRDLPPLVASLVTLSARVRGYKTDNTFTTAEIEAYKGDLEAMCNLTTTGAREETRHRWQGLPTPAFERTILWCNMFIFEEFIEELKGTVQVRQSLWDPCEYI